MIFGHQIWLIQVEILRHDLSEEIMNFELVPRVVVQCLIVTF